jgi:hypothetical protein
MAFVRDEPAKAASLAAQIQKLSDAHKDQNLRTFVVFVGGAETKPVLEKIAAEKKITIPLTFLPQGATQGDLAPYKINPSAKNTIMVYRRQQVQSRFVNVDENSFGEVAKAAAEVVK